MKRRFAKTRYICLTLLCTGVVFGCAPNQDTKVSVETTESGVEEESETTQETKEEQSDQETETADAHFYEQQMLKNEERFYEEAQEQGIEREEAAKYAQILAENNIFQDGEMALTGLRLDDIDGNGQMDMLVMVLDAKEEPFYGSGALWLYMNEDEPYCFADEDCSYYGCFDVFWDDIDSDGNVEIVLSAQGTGCGATGDFYKAIFKYRNPSTDGAGSDSENIIQMQLPSDFDYDYDFGIGIQVYQEPETDCYTAYCPYFDEEISFHAQNIGDWELPQEAKLVGGEVRGFYDLRVVQYEGKNVLQASEYLNGEGGTVHNVATAEFLITWKEDGTPEVIKWWIEEDKPAADVITVYTTEQPAHSDEKFPVVYTDDLSLLERMGQADCSYAEQDGNVYYRQYHRDSYEEGALWGIYQATAGTDKEIVRVNADGKRTVLFHDRGYGDIYLIGNRFYMTESVVEQVEDMEWTHDKVYSVDMQGRDRIDYGENGSIYFVDFDKKCIIMRFCSDDLKEKVFAVLNTVNGKLNELPLDTGNNCFFWDYHDGWCYFEEDSGDGIYRIVAVSLEGERREIIALTSDKTAGEYGYYEGICDLRVEGERIYIVFGGYAGSGHFYQGGRILTTKLDGSDYRAIECDADHYYVRQEQGRPLVYFPHYGGGYASENFYQGEMILTTAPASSDYRVVKCSTEDYETTVWDVLNNITYPCDFPVQLIDSLDNKIPIEAPAGLLNPMCVYHRNAEEVDFYALPDDSGRIVRVAMRIDEDITQRTDGQEYKIDYQHLYYADGYLYFEAEFNVYDREYAIGWRDGYRRIQTDVYRRRLADGEMELLYSY